MCNIYAYKNVAYEASILPLSCIKVATKRFPAENNQSVII